MSKTMTTRAEDIIFEQHSLCAVCFRENSIGKVFKNIIGIRTERFIVDRNVFTNFFNNQTLDYTMRKPPNGKKFSFSSHRSRNFRLVTKSTLGRRGWKIFFCYVADIFIGIAGIFDAFLSANK